MRCPVKVDVSKIKDGDRVKISLHGLPESGWLDVVNRGSNTSPWLVAVLPDGTGHAIETGVVTAHEPAAPALPNWWGAKVIRCNYAEAGLDFKVYDADGDAYADRRGFRFNARWFAGDDVTVVVDKDGNQPAAIHPDAFAQERRWREKAEAQVIELYEKRKAAEAERDEARADLDDLRAEVAKVRDDMRAVRSHWGADRLAAILGGGVR